MSRAALRWKRPLPRIDFCRSKRFERKATATDGHSTGKGSFAKPPVQGGRHDRPRRARQDAAGGDGQPDNGLAGRRAVRRGQPPQRLPRARAADPGRRDHAADTEAAGGDVLPRRADQALLSGRPSHGRRRQGGLRPGALDPQDREGRKRAGVRQPEPLARLAHDVRPRRGGRGAQRGALRRDGVPLPVARRHVPQLPGRGPRAVQGHGHGHRLRRRRLEAVRGLRRGGHRIGRVVEVVPARPAQTGRARRQVRRLRRARGARPGYIRGLPGGGVAALHRAPRARRRGLVPEEGGQGGRARRP